MNYVSVAKCRGVLVVCRYTERGKIMNTNQDQFVTCPDCGHTADLMTFSWDYIGWTLEDHRIEVECTECGNYFVDETE